MIIDSHHHLWTYSTEEYGWIDDRMSVIARDFTADDLRCVAEPLGVSGSVAVQARQVVAETGDLLLAAEASGFLRGVVGWLPPTPREMEATLAEFGDHPKLKGFRYVVQDEPANDFILGAEFNEAVSRVIAAPQDFVYDILIFERQLEASIEFVDRHPNGRFVLDHIAKPKVADGEVEPWRTNLSEIAKRENVVCKVSGVVTEGKWDDWSLDTIRPYLDAALEAFGPERLMYGSDWPVCLLATEYARWLDTVKTWASSLSADEQDAFFRGVATSAYHLSDA